MPKFSLVRSKSGDVEFKASLTASDVEFVKTNLQPYVDKLMPLLDKADQLFELKDEQDASQADSPPVSNQTSQSPPSTEPQAPPEPASQPATTTQQVDATTIPPETSQAPAGTASQQASPAGESTSQAIAPDQATIQTGGDSTAANQGTGVTESATQSAGPSTGNPETQTVSTGNTEQAGSVANTVTVEQLAPLPPVPPEFLDQCADLPSDPMGPPMVGVMHFYESPVTPAEQVGKRWMSLSRDCVCPSLGSSVAATYLTGIPCNAGVLKLDELKAAAAAGTPVPHALAITVPVLRPKFFYSPATQPDNADAWRPNNILFPVAGVRLRLKSTFNVKQFEPTGNSPAGNTPAFSGLLVTVLRTLQTYGAIVVGRGDGNMVGQQPTEPCCIVSNLAGATDAELAELDAIKNLANDLFLQSLELVKVDPKKLTQITGPIATASAGGGN